MTVDPPAGASTATSGSRRGLDARVARLADAFTGRLSVTALEVRTGMRVELNADATVPTASVIKVAVLCQAYEHLTETGLNPTVLIPIPAVHRVGGSGVLKSLISSEALSFEDLATLMVTVSDNTATNVLMQWAGGPDAVTERVRAYGLERTVVHDYVTSAVARRGVEAFAESTTRELCALGERLAGLTSVQPAWRRPALAILAAQQYRDLVTRYWDLDTTADLFEGESNSPVQVCSKTGFFPGMRAELGVVQVNDEPRMIYAAVADKATDCGMAAEAEPALACGLVGRELAAAWLSDVAGLRVLDTPYVAAWAAAPRGSTDAS